VTKLDVTEGRRLLAEATPGPWRIGVPGDPDALDEVTGGGIEDFAEVRIPWSEEDAALIVYAVNHLEALLTSAAQVEELRRAARAYVQWVVTSESYPGHEEYVEAEELEIHAELDAAEERLMAALQKTEDAQP
jgi:hypothetical protein